MESFIFKQDSDLLYAPLIPLRSGGFMLAAWILHPTPSNLNAWLFSILDDPNTRSHGLFGSKTGKGVFEQYALEQLNLCPYVKRIQKQLTVRYVNYPEIEPFLVKFGKKDGFEIDLVATTAQNTFIISCKRGERQLPKSSEKVRLGMERTEDEVRDLALDNLKAATEILLEKQCIESSKRLRDALRLGHCKNLYPTVICSMMQPLSIPEIRNFLNVDEVSFTTSRELPKFVSSVETKMT